VANGEASFGTPEQIAEILEQGLTDHIVFQSPSGDMTIEEPRGTLELFITEVKPRG
jgi:hypothetical protein